MDRLTDRMGALQGLLEDAEQAYRLVAGGDRVSGQALAALLKRREDLTREIHDLRDRLQEAEEDEGFASEAELVRAAIGELAALPDPLLDRVLSGIVDAGRGAAVRRAAPPGLHVVGE